MYPSYFHRLRHNFHKNIMYLSMFCIGTFRKEVRKRRLFMISYYHLIKIEFET